MRLLLDEMYPSLIARELRTRGHDVVSVHDEPGAGTAGEDAPHADRLSRHATEADAVAPIKDLIREGLAEPGEFNIREIDDAGYTIRVFGVPGGGAGSVA